MVSYMDLDEVRAKIIKKGTTFAEVDLIDKRFVKCPYCRSEVEIIPRENSLENLRHIQNVETVYEKMRGSGVPFIINFRWINCPSCQNKFIGKDKYTKIIF